MEPMASVKLLRQTLYWNAGFSGLSGLILALQARPIASLTGVPASWMLAALGACLLAYAIGLLAVSSRPLLNRQEIWMAVILDLGWVLGSAVLLILEPISLTIAGKWIVAIVADIVAIFATLQLYGLYHGPTIRPALQDREG